MTIALFRCGHPRTPENSWQKGEGQTVCKECGQARNRAEWAALTPEERRMDYRVRVLPTQLERAHRRYVELCREAVELSLPDLVKRVDLSTIATDNSGH